MSGPEPQKWSDTMTVSGKPIPTLAKYEITDIEWVYSVDFLKGLYPYEAKE